MVMPNTLILKYFLYQQKRAVREPGNKLDMLMVGLSKENCDFCKLQYRINDLIKMISMYWAFSGNSKSLCSMKNDFADFLKKV